MPGRRGPRSAATPGSTPSSRRSSSARPASRARSAPTRRRSCSCSPGTGELELAGERHALGPEAGAHLLAGERYRLHPEGSEPLRLVSVRIPDCDPTDRDPRRIVVSRLEDQASEAATTEREFRIIADARRGLRAATHFVGYIPTVRAPEHFHTYDEVIYVLEGVGVLHAEGRDHAVARGSADPAARAHRPLSGEHRR